jgi:hypothetical protein
MTGGEGGKKAKPEVRIFAHLALIRAAAGADGPAKLLRKKRGMRDQKLARQRSISISRNLEKTIKKQFFLPGSAFDAHWKFAHCRITPPRRQGQGPLAIPGGNPAQNQGGIQRLFNSNQSQPQKQEPITNKPTP